MSQEKKNRAADAQQLKDNPILKEAFIALKGAHIEAFSKVRKDDNYIENLKNVHDDMAALQRLERYIDRVITEGRLTEKPKVLQGDI